jgi:hypothetical protein
LTRPSLGLLLVRVVKLAGLSFLCNSPYESSMIGASAFTVSMVSASAGDLSGR